MMRREESPESGPGIVRTFYLSYEPRRLDHALRQRGALVSRRGERVVARTTEARLTDAILAAKVHPIVWAIDNEDFLRAKDGWL
jgi:hypothetical protein